VSARDLAVVARAFLAEPELVALSATPRYEFEGGDGLQHQFTNHNRFLRLYDGAIGLKTGTTRQAGRCFVAAARRDGRTMIAVLFDAPNIYATASALLDEGFATPVSAQVGLDRLPDVQLDAALDPPPEVVEPAAAVAAPLETVAADRGLVASPRHDLSFNSPQVAAAVFAAGLLPLVLVVRRRLYAGVLAEVHGE
jgi:D-alanyl-D-alanine carboxypeptidase